MNKNILMIKTGRKLLAVIIKASFNKNGLEFFVPEEFSQQLGYMKHARGHVIVPHVHKPILRKIIHTNEVLFIRSGKVRVDFYDEGHKYIESKVVNKGDVVFLASGGHGFEFIVESEVIEVKQGPFIKGSQPVRFVSVSKDRIKIKR